MKLSMISPSAAVAAVLVLGSLSGSAMAGKAPPKGHSTSTSTTSSSAPASAMTGRVEVSEAIQKQFGLMAKPKAPYTKLEWEEDFSEKPAPFHTSDESVKQLFTIFNQTVANLRGQGNSSQTPSTPNTLLYDVIAEQKIDAEYLTADNKNIRTKIALPHDSSTRAGGRNGEPYSTLYVDMTLRPAATVADLNQILPDVFKFMASQSATAKGVPKFGYAIRRSVPSENWPGWYDLTRMVRIRFGAFEASNTT